MCSLSTITHAVFPSLVQRFVVSLQHQPVGLEVFGECGLIPPEEKDGSC